MSKNRTIPFLVIGFVMAIWGVSFLSIKVTVAILSPMTLALSRFVIASVILIILLKIREPDAHLHKSDIPRMAVSGIVGISVYFYFENNGVKFTSASTASIIIATIPAFTVISDWLFCGNRLNWARMLGVVLSFLGVYLIVRDSGQLNFASQYFVGNLFMIGAALAWVVYSLVTRPLGQNYSRLAITTYQTLFGTLAIFPFALLETNKWALVDGTVIANIVFLGVFCSAFGYYGYVYAIGKLGVDMASLFINFIPVVTVVSSYFILGEKITPTQMLGGGIIISAVYLADLGNWFRSRVAPQTRVTKTRAKSAKS